MKTAQRAAIAASMAVKRLSWQQVSGLLWQVQVTVRAGPYKNNEFAMNAMKTHTESHNYVTGDKEEKNHEIPEVSGVLTYTDFHLLASLCSVKIFSE